MGSRSVSGTEGYAEEAEVLFERYESVSFESVHEAVLHLIPTVASDILDVGSGTGRDAAWFAAHGHRVVAVEPTTALRRGARSLHASPRIEWVDDSLPDLTAVRTRDRTFDLILLSAVWMHFDAMQRRRSMATIASLLRDGGMTILSVRDGPVPSGRRMFQVRAEETVGLASEHGLRTVLNLRTPSVLLGKPDVMWDRLAFVKGQGDG